MFSRLEFSTLILSIFVLLMSSSDAKSNQHQSKSHSYNSSLISDSNKDQLFALFSQFNQPCSIEIENKFYSEFKKITNNEIESFINNAKSHMSGQVCNRFNHEKCGRYFDLAHPSTTSMVERCICSPPNYWWAPKDTSKPSFCALLKGEKCTHKKFIVKSQVPTTFAKLNQDLKCGFGTTCSKWATCECNTNECIDSHKKFGDYLKDERPDTVILQNFVKEAMNENVTKTEFLTIDAKCKSNEDYTFWADDEDAESLFGIDAARLYEKIHKIGKSGAAASSSCDIRKNLVCDKRENTCNCLDGHQRSGEEGCKPAMMEPCSKYYKYKETWHPITQMECTGNHVICVLALDKLSYVCCPDPKYDAKMLKYQPDNFIRCPRP